MTLAKLQSYIMDKIKKYNQILFAILGTTLAIILLYAGIVFLIDEFRVRTYDDNTLIVKEELDSLKELNTRNQIISIEGIHSFDTATKTYLIPVYHKKLTDPTSRDDNILGLLDIKGSAGDFYYYGYGHYNNIILYNFSSSEIRVLLDKRVNIDRYNVFKSKKKSLIVFTGWDEDTNNDRKLNEDDFKQLYVYDHSTLEVKQVQNSKYRIIEYEYLSNVDKLVLKVTEIKENEGDKDERPEFLVLYSFKDNNLKPLVDLSILNQLQDIIDN